MSQDAEIVQPESKLKFPDEGWAVFNCHVNNAKKRAFRIVELRYGVDGLNDLKRASRKGIMSIFDVAPTPPRQLFASLCYVFTNGLDKEESSKESHA